MEPELMNLKQAAAHCDVSVSTFDKWRKREGLPYIQIGGVIRYRRSAIDEWLAARETTHVPAAPVVAHARRRRSHG